MEKVKKEKTIPPQTPVKLTVHQVLTPTQSQRKLQLYNKHNSSQIMIIKLWILRDQNSLSQLNKSKSRLEKKKRKKKKLLLHQILVQEKQEARKSKLKSNHSLKKKLTCLFALSRSRKSLLSIATNLFMPFLSSTRKKV